jgi:poly-gamma-glutamate synthesis protein (capsule biosynthesis protein)
MAIRIPQTPAEALDISLGYRLKMTSVLVLAKIFRFWNYPGKKMATDFAEMSWPDVYYWVHKTTNPITVPEKGETPESLCLTDASIVGLPAGFEVQNRVTFGTCADLLFPQGDAGGPSPLGLENSEGTLFENVADQLFDQDISFANFESPVTTQPLVKEVISNRAAPVECCSREQFNTLKGHNGKNFTIINTANNHTYDLGVEAMETTAKTLADAGIINLGVNATPAEYGKGKIITKNGIKIGFVSVTFGLNGHQVPEAEKYRIHQARICSKIVNPELELIQQQIEHCKAEGCDFIIAAMHWGYEFEMFPRKQQVIAARQVIEMGADSIISCHTHVIQPVEYYRSKRDPNRVAVIAYSLGSLTWGYDAPYLALSIILNMVFARGTHQGETKTYIESAKITPVFRGTFETNGRVQSRVEKLADHIHGRSTLYAASRIAKIKHYANLVLGNRDFWDEAATTASAPAKRAA